MLSSLGPAPRALFPRVSLCGVGVQSLLHRPPCEQGLAVVGKGGVGGRTACHFGVEV
jgi:hypothetical protein